jgi:hypothetical protein
MAHASKHDDMQQSATDKSVPQPDVTLVPKQPGNRRQDQADYAAWLREYRRWTQSGSCAPSRVGEIEWGGETCDTSKP